MKNQMILNKFYWLLAISFVLALSACKRSEEHPKEHPATTNAPAQTNPPPA